MLGQGKITVYHMTIVSDMAWFSSGTQLATLMVLSQWLLKTNQGRRKYMYLPAITVFRIMCMIVICILLMVIIWMQGYRYWYDGFTMPAHCIPRNPSSWGGTNEVWAIISLILLAYGYIASIGTLVSFARMTQNPLPPMIRKWDSHIRQRLQSSGFESCTYLRMRKLVLGLWYMVQSEVFSLVFNLLWIILGIVWTTTDRQLGEDAMTEKETDVESEIGFGQLVAIILLMLPFMAWFEGYHSTFEAYQQLPAVLKLITGVGLSLEASLEGLQRSDTENDIGMNLPIYPHSEDNASQPSATNVSHTSLPEGSPRAAANISRPSMESSALPSLTPVDDTIRVRLRNVKTWAPGHSE